MLLQMSFIALGCIAAASPAYRKESAELIADKGTAAPSEKGHRHRNKADLIFTGGTVITMNDNNPKAEALAVKGEKIIAVGTNHDIFKLKRASTRIVELEGTETLMPGLIEPHSHPALVTGLAALTDVSGFLYSSFAEVKEVMEDTVDAIKPADPLPWVLFKGWDPALISDLPPLDAKTLDSLVTAEYPVFVIAQSLHSAWVNTKALEICNITTETEDPYGGKIVRDENGNPTGLLKEQSAINIVGFKIPQPSSLERAEILVDVLQQYSQNGFTTVADMGSFHFDPILSYTRNPECPVRLAAYYTPYDVKPSNDYANKKLWFPGVKIWADGSPFTGSMAVAEPYLPLNNLTEALGFDYEHYPSGFLIYDSFEDQLNDVQQFQDELLVTHCEGEVAIQRSLEVYEQLIQNNPGNSDHRYRLDHNGLITEEQLGRATELGITVSFYINQVYFYGAALRDSIIGPDRAARFTPTGLATAMGQTHWTLHDDAPVFPIDPFVSIRTSVKREMLKDPGCQLGAEYASTIDEALKAYTINAAWQMKRENDLGSLEVGKLADLVVLSENPKAMCPEDLPDIQVLQTYLGGQLFNHSNM